MFFEVVDLNFDYPNRDLDYHLESLLCDVHFSLVPGSLLHIQGNNGSGKTTLLKLIAGLLLPTRGEIRYQGQSIRLQKSIYQEQICYLGHKTGISPGLTVWENCQFDLKRKQSDAELEALLQQFELWDLKDQSTSLLSAGQKRRIGLIRVLGSNTPLWLLDEPLVALDQPTISLLMAAIQAHIQRNGVVIFTSHQRLPIHSETYQEYCL